MALYGYDLSSYQKVGTGDNAKDFIICKATEGTGYVDKLCDQHYQRAKKQGKLLGFYHFARPDLNKGTDGAIKEAQYFVKNCKNYFGEAIPCLDWEQPGTTSQVAWAKAFLDEVYKETKVRPLIYMSASVVNGNNWQTVVDGNYGLWIAGYPTAYNKKNPPTPTTAAMPYKIGKWPFWAIWQYSSSAGTLDLNIANMDAKGWKKYAAKANANQTPVTQPKDENEAPKSNISGQEPTQGASTGSGTTPKQPNSTDKGLTAEEWNKIMDKAEQTVDLAKDTADKFGFKVPMSNKVYDVLKVIVAIVLPLISTLYIGLANIWGFGFGEQVDKTIQLLIAAINALLGMAIVKSSSDYHSQSS